MKKLFLLFILGLVICSCSVREFEIQQEIHPKITILNNDRVALEYMLGDLLVLDEFRRLNAGQIVYFSNHKDKEIDLTVFIIKVGGVPPVFWYFLGENALTRSVNTVTTKILIDHSKSIENFVWLNEKD